MMKWAILIGVTLIAVGCTCTTTQVVQFRRVIVAPVVEPVILDVGYPGPIDVTTTTIDYY